MTNKRLGWEFLSLALTAFAGLGIEVLYAYLLEPKIYGAGMQDWTTGQTIAHWILTCITWLLIGYYVIRESKVKLEFNVFEKVKTAKWWQWGAVVLCVLMAFIVNNIDRDELKVIREFKNMGILLFGFQYVYYLVETILFLLIIVFAQKAFEVWFRNDKIPYGGIICAVTWGFAHAFTKGSLFIGLQGIVLGMLLGSMYLLVNKDIRKSYILMFLVFVL